MNIVDLVKEYGAKNLRFFIPLSKLQYAGIIPGIAFRTSDQPEHQVLCTIDESRYLVEDGYKIKLKALNPEYGSQTYYQSDLSTLLTNCPDTHQVFLLTIDGYQRFLSTDQVR